MHPERTALEFELTNMDDSYSGFVRIDFTNSYRRRNVAPRDGLGRLEATRFRFSG